MQWWTGTFINPTNVIFKLQQHTPNIARSWFLRPLFVSFVSLQHPDKLRQKSKFKRCERYGHDKSYAKCFFGQRCTSHGSNNPHFPANHGHITAWTNSATSKLIASRYGQESHTTCKRNRIKIISRNKFDNQWYLIGRKCAVTVRCEAPATTYTLIGREPPCKL